ncbi:unnamed protein product [Peronospora belbahrii]|uniref:Uncharacterized protein n=1 Tax=Peronospora belbahrii TaxID=622444 RepID=A0ABN8CMA2_9STRA|nr:unnamed protein product [Peronospora belbahrii]
MHVVRSSALLLPKTLSNAARLLDWLWMFFPKEPAKNGEPFDTLLRGLLNVILTPHIGGSNGGDPGQHCSGGSVKAAALLPPPPQHLKHAEIDMLPIRTNSMRILHCTIMCLAC